MNKQKVREEIIYLARDNPKLALERANALVCEMPDEIWTWWTRSDVHESLKDFKNAIHDIDQAITINFSEPGSHFAKALIFIKLNEYDSAIESFTDAIVTGKKLGSEYYEVTSFFMRAFCYCKIDRFEEAESDLNHVHDDMQTWIDRLRSKAELAEACRNRRLN